MSSSTWVTNPKDQTQALDEVYELGASIGQPGQFGQAYKITHKKTGEVRAVKVVSKSKFPRKKDKIHHLRQLRDEIKCMRSMEHKNIIEMYEVFETNGHLYVVMECCSGGELFDRIKAQKGGSYSEKDAQGVLKQCIEGIAYMHEMKIAHCDLKPDNFLFLDASKDATLKIIDFGMSKLVEKRKYLRSFRGTPYYVAPEVLEGKYSEHCDVWSFGVVMFVMLFGFPPFHANNDDDIFKKIRKGFTAETKKGYGSWFPLASKCGDNAKDLIGKCLNSDPVDRPSAKEVLEHEFFKSAASSEALGTEVLKNLKDFTGKVAFKKEVLNTMSDIVTQQSDVQKLKESFEAIDANGDGVITKEELINAFKGRDPEELKKLMALADFDGDGTLDYNEMLLTAVDRKLAAKEERIWKAFCKFDKDLDGKITAEEIQAILKCDEAAAKNYIKEIDADGDGSISWDEFVDMWMAKEEA